MTLRPAAAYLLASGLSVSSVVAAIGSTRCLQPILFARAAACGPAAGTGAPVVAVGFAAALLVVVSRKAALGVALVAVNLLFAWTSRLLEAVSPVLSLGVSRLLSLQNQAVWRALGLNSAQASASATDVEGLILLALVAALVATLGSGGAAKKAAKGLGVAASLLVVLGAEVALFDSGALFQHVTTVQAFLDVAPWFTNADLLILASGSLALLGLGWRAQHRL